MQAIMAFRQLILLLLACYLTIVLSWSLPTTLTLRHSCVSSSRFHRKYPSLLVRDLSRSSANIEMSLPEPTKDYFKGHNVLLTGASGGLGRSIALKLATCGITNMILTARNIESLEKVAKECRAVDTNLKVEVLTCDLADPDSVSKLAKDALEICPTIDILINNGGVSSRSRFVDTKLDVDQRLMQINFFSGACLAKAVVPGMIEKQKGAIIWISSVQGLVGIPERTSYAASKFAVQGYCEALRGELASSGITVHVASPGYIRTNLSLSAVTGDGKLYGKLDETTANGEDPDKVASDIITSVSKGKADFVVAATISAVAAIWMRLLCPSFLRSLLVKRYEKAQRIKDGDKEKNE